jgi:glycosyltransferase involved in cell wall biosynthesis
MAGRGHEVHVFTTNVDGDRDSAVPIGVPVNMSGVNVWYFPVPAFRRLYWSPRMGRELDRQMRDFSIVHTHSVFLWPPWVATQAARRHGVPYVMAPRGMLVQELVRRKSRMLKNAWIGLIERGNIESASAIHVTSHVEEVELHRFGFRLPKVYEVPNGVGGAEPAGVDDGQLGTHIEACLASDRPILLYLGRIHWVKGLDLLIAALRDVPGAVLLIVGSDDEGYAAKLASIADEMGVRERVVFAGPVYGAAKANLYRRAALLVLASFSENFGNVVLEAMAAGCPVVVTPEVGAASVVSESGGGVVVRREPDALAAAIRDLLADGPRRVAIGARARRWMQSRYSWDVIAARMLEVYQCVIGARKVIPGPG